MYDLQPEPITPCIMKVFEKVFDDLTKVAKFLDPYQFVCQLKEMYMIQPLTFYTVFIPTQIYREQV